MKKITITVLLATLMSGCVGAFVPVQTMESTGMHTAEAAFKMPVVTPDKAKSLEDLGEVTGYSCKNKLWDPDATSDAATYQVKLSAAMRSATAITSLTCEPGSVSLLTNCWQSVTCKATALR